MVEKHPPKRCPNCGEFHLHLQEYWVQSPRSPEDSRPLKGIGYDVHCKACGWSGHISPDSDSEITEKEAEG